jgi:TupA-like ATPgrasp
MGSAKRVAKKILPELAVDTLRSMRNYRDAHGAYPNLLFPKTFSEKVVHRSLFDRRPILRQFADKFAVRTYVAERLGDQILPRLYWVTETPDNIPFAQLPNRFVVKPTHGAGWIRIVRDKSALDIEDLIRECRFWLSQNFYERWGERVYKDIPRRILVEEFLSDGSADVPADYKLFVFHGRVEIIGAIYDRFANTSHCICDRDWNALKVGLGYPLVEDAKRPPAPRHLAEMIGAAETLGRGIDFVRVDFYDTPDQIYFGEITTTPAAGLLPFHPAAFDRRLGSLW